MLMVFRKTEREQDLTTVVRTQLTGVEGVWGCDCPLGEQLRVDIGGHNEPEQEGGRDQRN